MSDQNPVSDTAVIIVVAILCATLLTAMWIVFR